MHAIPRELSLLSEFYDLCSERWVYGGVNTSMIELDHGLSVPCGMQVQSDAVYGITPVIIIMWK